MLQGNEGKRVIISGVIRPDGAVVDELTGAEFDAIKVDRLVETYELVESNQEDEPDYYEWKTTNRTSSNNSSSFIYATCHVGEFAIDQKMLSSLQVTEKISEFNGMVLARKGYYPYRIEDVVYISKYFYLPENGFSREEGKPFENVARISYKSNPAMRNKNIHLLGFKKMEK